MYIKKEALKDYPESIFLDIRDAQSREALPLTLTPQQVISPAHLPDEAMHLDDSAHYIVVCMRGISAVPVAEYLRAQGFAADVLEGGVLALTAE